jgi:magnesium-protoporphyrin IX monomethyl ester (oxidative) cyclase
MSTTAPTLSAAPLDTDDSTRKASTESVLTPRFYTTDMQAIDQMDITPVAAQWEKLMQEFRQDTNRRHFQRDDSFTQAVNELPPELYQEFMDFLVSSCTSEFSGCVLYADIKKAVDNPAIKELMGHMARDESRHSGFINKALKDFGCPVDLAELTKSKQVTFFKPKFIYYATYLSEKIGYARYITIYRQLEREPERRFHPIFKWFQDWCNDEFRHGEAFALMMRTDPGLVKGVNKLWIRFFLVAVFATMYVRDHERPRMHEALGLPPAQYGFTVFRITSDISKQIFPFTLDLDHPAFARSLNRLVALNEKTKAAKERGGIFGAMTRASCAAQAGLTFARLYLLPTIPNELPANARLDPVW